MSASFRIRYIFCALLLLSLSAGSTGFAGETVPFPGLREHTPQVHAFTNARLVISPYETIDKGTLVIRDGNIVSAGKNVPIPADAKVWDLTGKTIYAGFIDPYSNYGVSATSGGRRGGSGADSSRGVQTSPGSPYWNPHVTPQKSAAKMFSYDSTGAEKLRNQGFVAVLSFPTGNIITGTAALVNTGRGLSNDLIFKGDLALHIGFQTGGWGDDTYPGSLMGAVALIRQSYFDADWYTRAHEAWAKAKDFPRPEENEALARLAELKTQGVPVLLDAKDEKAFLRNVALARELGLAPIIYGSNFEYRRTDEIAALNTPVILPLNFPEAPAVKSPEEALQINSEQLRHWYLAPENALQMKNNGLQIAFTGFGLKEGDFLEPVRKVIERGLRKEDALAAITTSPAQILGVANRYGTLSPGKAASFVVTDGELFEQKTKILETWVEGERFEVKAQPDLDVRGDWLLSFSAKTSSPDTVKLELKGELASPSGNIVKGKKAKLDNLQYGLGKLSFTFNGDSLGFPGVVQMSALVQEKNLSGQGVWPDGENFKWSAGRLSGFTPEPDTSKPKKFEPLALPRLYPDGEFGFKQMPQPEKSVAFINATIWTSSSAGIIEKGTLLVQNGKITGVGPSLKVPAGAKVVDLSGKEITPGLIDCHSHTAIDGDVNEGGQTITAEVEIGDVVDDQDIQIYRQLAGGLTCANLLHGSANAIGGHNQVIKLRWGKTPQDMKFAQAPQGIKFALGENPKQSNWGDQYTSRYPQTRMGVEQIIRDEFVAAREYAQSWKSYAKSKRGLPPRRDLEMEAVAEILAGTRLVHSHSYRQDEILMLIRLAEEFDVKIATFQHILEGYMVADALAAHGAGASCFSDWWAYKFEVYDAIPYDGALMHDQGVVVSFNSDSGEMARRLNTEAAKAVKYGGLAPQEALKFVTLNPAIQLGIDKWVGSLEPGKDADFAVWDGNPLSTYSRCEQTWIDGAKYFDREEDSKMREEVQKERAQLIQRILSDGDKGGKDKDKGKPWGEKPPYSCVGIEEDAR